MKRNERRQALANIEKLTFLAKKALDNLEAVESLYPEVEKYIYSDETLMVFYEREKFGNLTMFVYDYHRDYPEFWSEAGKSGKKSKCINNKLVALLEEISNFLSDICKCGMDMQEIDVKFIVDHIEQFDVSDILEAFSDLQKKIESLEFDIDETGALEDVFPDFLFDENGDLTDDDFESDEDSDC